MSPLKAVGNLEECSSTNRRKHRLKKKNFPSFVQFLLIVLLLLPVLCEHVSVPLSTDGPRVSGKASVRSCMPVLQVRTRNGDRARN